MSIIYKTDPDAPQKLRQRLADLERELQYLQAQDRLAKEYGYPKNPPNIMDSLRSRIRQTKQRLAQIEQRQEER